MKMKKLTANNLIALLHDKHPVDKFLAIEECKTGSTWFQYRCPRLDMWVMARSWAHPRFIGYEVKISRSDFLNDTKWTDYLDYCTEFYFVAPPNVIEITEVPEQAGLLVATKNCKRLLTKKKAPVRNIEIPQSLLIYILMCRTQIVGDMSLTRPTIAIWQERLKQLKSNRKLGSDIAWQIRLQVEKRVKAVQDENRLVRTENERFRDIKEFIESKGVTINDISNRWGGVKEDKLTEIITGLPFNLCEYLRVAEKNIAMAADALENSHQISKADK